MLPIDMVRCILKCPVCILKNVGHSHIATKGNRKSIHSIHSSSRETLQILNSLQPTNVVDTKVHLVAHYAYPDLLRSLKKSAT